MILDPSDSGHCMILSIGSQLPQKHPSPDLNRKQGRTLQLDISPSCWEGHLAAPPTVNHVTWAMLRGKKSLTEVHLRGDKWHQKDTHLRPFSTCI